MLNTQQDIHRSLECVWRPCGTGLSCMWVAAHGTSVLGERDRNERPHGPQKSGLKNLRRTPAG